MGCRILFTVHIVFFICVLVDKGTFVLWSNAYLCLITSDRVFGPTTTTRHVFDVAAQHVVSGAMEGINGNFVILFASLLYVLFSIFSKLKCL